MLLDPSGFSVNSLFPLVLNLAYSAVANKLVAFAPKAKIPAIKKTEPEPEIQVGEEEEIGDFGLLEPPKFEEQQEQQEQQQQQEEEEEEIGDFGLLGGAESEEDEDEEDEDEEDEDEDDDADFIGGAFESNPV